MYNFEGTYEIMGQNGPCGSLEVTKKGLYTLFCASCTALDGVQRVAVSDLERECVLGVLMPTAEGCTMRRLMSDHQLKQTGLQGIRLSYIAGLDRCEAEPKIHDDPLSLPLNIGGEFACPESFVTLRVEDREDGLYGIVSEL